MKPFVSTGARSKPMSGGRKLCGSRHTFGGECTEFCAMSWQAMRSLLVVLCFHIGPSTVSTAVAATLFFTGSEFG
jgi:hypothetical protein